MKNNAFFVTFLLVTFFCPFHYLLAQDGIPFGKWKFQTGDRPEYANFGFDDNYWEEISTAATWESQGHDNYNGFGWYRIHFRLKKEILTDAIYKDSVVLNMTKIDDCDEVFFNGKLVGKTGTMPQDEGGYKSYWDKIRRYKIAANDPCLKWGSENVIAVRVYDGVGGGGIYGGTCSLETIDISNFIEINTDKSDFIFLTNGQITKKISIKNTFKEPITAEISISVHNSKNANITHLNKDSEFYSSNEEKIYDLSFKNPNDDYLKMTVIFVESRTNKVVKKELVVPYILTPPPPTAPKINAVTSYGAHPNTPFQYLIPTTGQTPIVWKVEQLPNGLKCDKSSGIISGKVEKIGTYEVFVTAKNAFGTDRKKIKLVIGDKIALTPPMGWNSWNCWGLSVNDEKVRASAKAMQTSSLSKYGWSYINIDDGWMDKHDENGIIKANKKFPNMKKLGDYVHGLGLKYGIYSSPGNMTCGGYEGSYQFEKNDAKTYADWGVDYLKYDWCSYENIAPKQPNRQQMQAPFVLMKNELNNQKRDIVFSVCNFGAGNIWEWAADIGVNCWRTTGDINDTWESLSGIGFQQNLPCSYSKPSGWGDPDMLIVGKLGWGDDLHYTNLTPHEQYTHLTLWALLSSPLLIGCDLANLDDFTKNLLTNSEVIAIDQDELGKAAEIVKKNEHTQIWKKSLADGSYAIGIFNLDNSSNTVNVDWKNDCQISFEDSLKVRDLWRQKNTSSTNFAIPAHGSVLLKISK